MTLTKTSPLLERAHAATQKAQEDLLKTQALLADLSDVAPQPEDLTLFGYCATQGLKFAVTGSQDERRQALTLLLKTYPPEPLVDLVEGSRTQKPKAMLRENELAYGAMEPLFPVVFKSSKDASAAARWWSVLPSGRTEIAVAGATPEDLGLPNAAFSPSSQTYATGASQFFLIEPPAFPAPQSAVAQWMQAWDAMEKSLTTKEGRTQGDVADIKRMLATLRTVVASDNVSATTNGVLLGHMSPEHPLCRAVRKLDAAETSELRLFCETQKQALEDVLQAREREAEKVAAWVEQTLSPYASLPRDSVNGRRLSALVHKELGLAVTLEAPRRAPAHSRPDWDRTYLVRLQMPGTVEGYHSNRLERDLVVRCTGTERLLPEMLVKMLGQDPHPKAI